MRYNIENVIKRLQEAQRKGKTIIDEAELLRIVAPKINNIDQTIKVIESAVDKIDAKTSKELRGICYYVSISDAEKLTGIPRKTFYRWLDDGIITIVLHLRFNIKKLKETLEQIKKQKSKMPQFFL